MRKKLIFSALLVYGSIAVSSQIKAGSFDGRWNFTFSCAQATGQYADRCKAGDRDYFRIDLISQGNLVCGQDYATVQLGNHVDEGGLIEGTYHGDRAKVQFNVFDMTGTAELEFHGQKLHWHVNNQKCTGFQCFGPPKDVMLDKQPGEPVVALSLCKGYPHK